MVALMVLFFLIPGPHHPEMSYLGYDPWAISVVLLFAGSPIIMQVCALALFAMGLRRTALFAQACTIAVGLMVYHTLFA